MPTTTTAAGEDARIRERLDSLAQALRAKDVDALMAHYAPDTVTFDVGTPLQIAGADAYRRNFAAWFASVRGPLGFEMRDLHVSVGDDIGFCHYLGHVSGTRTTGEKTDYWVRVTSGLRKMKGRWLIIHEHVSVPIHMETMQGALDLQP
jgi:ketosteroid isomerase-like protein